MSKKDFGSRHKLKPQARPGLSMTAYSPQHAEMQEFMTMPEVYNAAKQGPRELPDGHPHKGGAVFFKPRPQTISSPPSAPSPSEEPAVQGSAQGEELPDPMQPAIDAWEEMLKRDFGDRYNPKE